MRWIAISLGLAGCLVGQGNAELARKQALDAQLTAAGWMIPEVPTWDATQLQQALNSPSPPVILDVRAPEERAVSMLPGAIDLQTYEAAGDALAGRPVVVYCTVGVRSGKWAAQARSQGVEAYNLSGGVLSWSWIGGDFEDEGVATKRVHVWSRAYSLLADDYEAVW